MIEIVCPFCAQTMEVSRDTPGMFVSCAGCGRRFEVPTGPLPTVPPPLPADAVQADPPRLPLPPRSKWVEEDDRPRRRRDERGPSPNFADIAVKGDDDHPILGRFVREYGNAGASYERSFMIGCGTLFLIASPVVFFLTQLTWLRWVSAILGILAFLVVLGAIIEIIEGKPAGHRVRLYEGGFFAECPDKAACRWEDIAELRDVGLGTDANKQLPRVRTRDGATITLDPKIQNIQEFADLLIERTSEFLLADAEDRLDTEGQAPFGRRLRVHTHGLELDRRVIPWEEIEEVQVLSRDNPPGFLILPRRGPERLIDQADVANLSILIDLLRARFQVRVVVD